MMEILLCFFTSTETVVRPRNQLLNVQTSNSTLESTSGNFHNWRRGHACEATTGNLVQSLTSNDFYFSDQLLRLPVSSEIAQQNRCSSPETAVHNVAQIENENGRKSLTKNWFRSPEFTTAIRRSTSLITLFQDRSTNKVAEKHNGLIPKKKQKQMEIALQTNSIISHQTSWFYEKMSAPVA